MNKWRQSAVGAVAIALAVPLPAAADILAIPGCRATMPGQWQVSGDRATLEGSTVRIRQAQTPNGFIQMTRDDGFQQVSQTAALIVFSHALTGGGRQVRGITRTSPSCAVDVTVGSADKAALADAIARSVANVPRP